jgi:hypothetical protein
VYYLFRPAVQARQEWLTFGSGVAAGMSAVVFGALLNGLAIWVAKDDFALLGPELLDAPLLASHPEEVPHA